MEIKETLKFCPGDKAWWVDLRDSSKCFQVLIDKVEVHQFRGGKRVVQYVSSNSSWFSGLKNAFIYRGDELHKTKREALGYFARKKAERL